MHRNGTGSDIAAVASAIGESGISVIRMSGPDAIRLFSSCWKGPDLPGLPANAAVFGRIMEGDAVVDEGIAILFRAPKSYTGEDTVEFSCHGGYLNTRRVLERILQCGFTPAAPGEFTHRAFLNGKMDLTQAEAVADLIHARSEAELRNASRQLDGALGLEMRRFRQDLIDFTALIELELDFSEEDVEFARRDQLVNLLDRMKQETMRLLDSYRAGTLIRDGVQTAIAGLPNAGKSTLLNALLQRDRAIVSHVAGTTRDTIEAEWSYQGLRFILVDTAGIRETGDFVEAMGVERSREALLRADVVVLLADAADPEQLPETVARHLGLDAEDQRVLKVQNKVEDARPPDVRFDVHISAKHGTGLALLKDQLFQKAVANRNWDPGRFALTSARHKNELSALAQRIDAACALLQSPASGEFVALELRAALFHLGNITGQITTEDLLDSIFSRFCIGK